MALEDEVRTLVQLVGHREYLANAQQVAGANEEMAASTETLGRNMERTTKRGYLMNQALFTLRRMTYAVTLATVATGVAALDLGWKYNNAMQQAQVALRPVFDTTQALQKELTGLYNFTKYTPFQFKDVTTAFRLLYASFHPLGISVATTNDTLKALTDQLSYAGKVSPGSLQRVSLALQHMANQGHLTGYAVNQLSRDGIQMGAVLRKEFKLTGEQIHNIGQLGIPTLDVLKAIIHYTETTKGPMDAARRLALGTLHGQFTTFKDNLGQIMGAVEKGFFHRFQSGLTRMNNFFNSIADQMQGRHSLTGLVSVIDMKVSPTSHGVLMFWRQLSGAVEGFFKFFTRLIGSLATSETVWGMLYIALALLNGAFKFLNANSRVITDLLQILLPMWVAWHIYLKAAAFWTAALSFEEAVLTKKTKDLTFAQAIMRLWLDRAIYTEKIGIGVMLLYGTALQGVSTALAWARLMLAQFLVGLEITNTSLLVGLTAVFWPVALLAVFVLLIDKVKAFRDEAEKALKLMQLSGGSAPWTNSKGGVNWQNVLLGGKVHLGIHNPFKGKLWGFADGGTVASTGTYMVGERGPELVTLPQGAQVTSNEAVPGFNRKEAWMASSRQPIQIILKLNERVLETVMTEIDTDRTARA